MTPTTNLHVAPSDSLSPEIRRALRVMLDTAYDGDFTDHDWAHALGGVHVWIEGHSGPVSHASVVPRTMSVGSRRCLVGYVEAVATAAPSRHRGLATAVMQHIGDVIRERYELGALSTGEPGFYERLGWQRWRGPSFVMTHAGREPTPDDDGGLMVLLDSPLADVDLNQAIVADWRPGDIW